MTELVLHFEDVGRGKPLLLVHGFPFSSTMWENQLRHLAPSARVLALDLPGFGNSPPSTRVPSIQAYAEDCVALLDALDILEPVVVGGLSMGGYVALAFARHFPERLAGILLASTRASSDSVEGKSGRDQAIANVQAQGIEALVNSMHPKLLAPGTYAKQPRTAERLKEIMLSTDPDGAAAALTAMRDRPDSTDLLSELDIPALVIHGEQDGVIPIHEAEQMVARLPQGQLVRTAHAGHLPNMEQPAVFNQELGAFLARI